MSIVVLEDDHIQAGPIAETLALRFPGVKVEIIDTEQEFRGRIDEFRRKPPDLFVLDVMVRWAEPTRDLVPPPEDAVERRRAGIRCTNLLLNEPLLRPVPRILYTILERRDLERDGFRIDHDTHLLRKSADPEPLVLAIRSRIGSAPRASSG